jgi:hypothetical protein
VVDFIGVFEVQRAHNACDDKGDGNKQQHHRKDATPEFKGGTFHGLKINKKKPINHSRLLRRQQSQVFHW